MRTALAVALARAETVVTEDDWRGMEPEHRLYLELIADNTGYLRPDHELPR